MAKVICAISGLELKVSYVGMTLRDRELAHPIFYLPQKKLLTMYEMYIQGKYNDIDSYLLFLALLNATDHVKFACPVKYRGEHTQKVIANNIDMLVQVMWKSAVITHPAFKQPKYIITDTIKTNSLLGIGEWLDLWQENITIFHMGYARQKHLAKLSSIEKKLERVILSGTTGPQLAMNVAKWADKAAEFPKDKRELWMKTIRKCFNSAAMFSTPKALLKEIKTYCEGEIEVGTIHFHKLMEVLREGEQRHNDFLGLGDISLPSAKVSTNYTMMDEEVASNAETNSLIDIIAKAPTEPPSRENYPSSVAYLRAKLNYRVYCNYKEVEEEVTVELQGDTINV